MKYSAHKTAIYCEDAECQGCQLRRFERNRPFVKFILNRYFPGWSVGASIYGADRNGQDMLQSGHMGLWHACLRRDPARSDAEWRGYAFQCIHGYILTSMRDAGKAAYEREFGHRPEVIPIDFSHTPKAQGTPSSKGEGINFLVNVALQNLERQHLDLGNRAWWKADEDWGNGEKALLERAIASLSERDRIVLSTRLDGGTLEDVGEKLGLTRERARQLQHKALGRLFYLFHSRPPKKGEIEEMTRALCKFAPHAGTFG